METHQKGLAEKALAENLRLYVDLQKDPKTANLHIALIQIALQLDQIQDEQRATKRLLERLAGEVLR